MPTTIPQRQRLIDALSGAVSGKHGGAFAALAEQFRRQQEKAVKEQAQADSIAQAGEASAFSRLYQGSPESEGALPASGVGPGAPLPATEARPFEAIVKAMTSKYAPIQKLGEEAMQAHFKQKPSEANKLVSYGGRFYDTSSGKPVDVGGAEYKTVLGPDGEEYQIGPDGKKTPVKGGPQTVIDMTGKGGQKFWEKQAESVVPGGESYKAASAASTGLLLSTRAASLLPSVKTGLLEPAVQFGRKLAAEFGIPTEGVSNADELAAVLKDSAFRDLGGLGNQVSDGDRQFVNEFTGSLSTDPVALKRMLALRIARQIREVDAHNERVRVLGQKLEDPSIESMSRVPDLIKFPDKELEKMVANVLMGRDTVAGLAVRQSPSARPAPAQRSGPSPDLAARMNRYLKKP